MHIERAHHQRIATPTHCAAARAPARALTAHQALQPERHHERRRLALITGRQCRLQAHHSEPNDLLVRLDYLSQFERDVLVLGVPAASIRSKTKH